MPRQPRLDAPGTLHHVMGRGIERTRIFQDDVDRTDFVRRLGALCRDRQLTVYAWALPPKHFHLLVRTGERPLFQSMKKLLTGYVVNFNRRHKRLSRKIVDLVTVARKVLAKEAVPGIGVARGDSPASRCQGEEAVLSGSSEGHGVFGGRGGALPGGDDLVGQSVGRVRGAAGTSKIPECVLEPTSPSSRPSPA